MRAGRRRAYLNKVVTTPTWPTPAQAAVIHRDEHLRVALPRPSRQLLAIEQIVRAARAVEQHQPAVVAAMRQDVIDHRPQRSQSNAAGH